jgi:GNAT superfamily N-acetyltransferase
VAANALTIRLATAADAAVLAELRWRLRTETSQPIEDHDAFVARCQAWFETSLASEQWFCWLCETAGRAVGSLILHVVGKVPNPVGVSERLGYITSVFLEPDVRNQGAGTLLLDEATRVARGLGCEALILWPTARSVPFYRRAGFDVPADMLELRLEG